jgi:signal transduction histidine kinase
MVKQDLKRPGTNDPENTMSFRDLKVMYKFILWFLMVAIVPFLIATLVSYDRSSKALEQETAKILVAIAENKSNQIVNYLNEVEQTNAGLSYLPEIIEILRKFREVYRSAGPDSDEYKLVDEEYRPFFKYYQKTFGYEDVLVLDQDGNPVFSLKKEVLPKSLYETALYGDSELFRAFVSAKKNLKIGISDFEFLTGMSRAHVFLVAPILAEGEFKGAVAVKMNTGGLDKMVQDYKDQGETGETIIFSTIQGKTVSVTPYRFPYGKKDKDSARIIKNVIENGEKTGIFIDYREKEVLAVWRYIPSFRMGVLVKMDREEVFASAKELRNTLVSISVILFLVAILLAYAAARTIAGPIKELTEVSSRVTRGDLEARAAARSRDEIGELARAFNKMTDSLVEAKNSVEQKKTELEEQKKVIEKANKELDNFVHTASHDLMGPPIMISAYANYLYEGTQNLLDDRSKSYLEKIRTSAKRMKDIIDDLLLLSRISRIKNPYEKVNTGDLVKKTVDRMEYEIKEKHAEVVVAGAFPELVCDRIKLAEVFLNLVANAVKFSSKAAGRTPRIEIGVADKRTEYEFFVKDNGIGIDQKHHKEIFLIFKRLHTQDEYPGTGAGLSIVEKVVNDHEGRIWVESEPGKGATFFFTIPKDLKASPPQ